MSAERDERLSALLDGALPAEEERALRAELARAPALRERLAALEAVDAELRALPGRSLPAGLHARLRARIDARPGTVSPRLARPPGGAPPQHRTRWRVGVAAAAAAAALAWYALPRVPDAPSPEAVANRAPAAGAAAERGPAAGDAASQQMTRALEALAYGTPDDDRAVVEVLDELVGLGDIEGSGRG